MSEQQITKICPFCGSEINAEAKKCRFCGSWLESPQAPVRPVSTAAPETKPDSSSSDRVVRCLKAQTVLMAIILVLLIALVVGHFILLFNFDMLF